MSHVSIIMPIWNQLEFTKKAIETLYEFTEEKDFDLIVFDNGSTDGTREWFYGGGCRESKAIHYVWNETNIGWCAGLNEAMKYTFPEFPFILWANNDIVFEKDWLPKMLAHFRSGIGAVGPISNYVRGRQRVELNDGRWEEEVQWLIGFCLMFRRGVIDALGPVDERFSPGGSEEFDYIIRMQKSLGLKCVIARDVYIHHFGSISFFAQMGESKEKYNEYWHEKHKILEEKWGKEFIDGWIQQEIGHVGVRQEKSPWPDNCKLGWAMPLTWPYINRDTHLSQMIMERPPLIYHLKESRGGELDGKREAQIFEGMQLGCTHFWICDADMVFPQDILVDLFKLLEDGADLAGGLCFRGYPPWEPVIWPKGSTKTLVPLVDFQFGDVIRDVGATGAACLLVKREVFEKVPRPWFQYRLEKILAPDGKEAIDSQGEDNYFTRKATAAGFRLDICTGSDVIHIREWGIDRRHWMIQQLLQRCGDWDAIMALNKKLADRAWFDREILGGSTPINWEINQRPYEIGLLYNFLKSKNIKTILEVGTQKGGTALLWATLVEPQDGHVCCVDYHFEKEKVYDTHPLKSRITEIEGDSHSTMIIQRLRDIIANNGGLIDFLFIDGDHSYQGVKADFEAFAQMVKPGGWIAFHDILDTEWQRSQNCHVATFWNEIKERFNHIEFIDPNDKRWMGIGLLEWK